MPASPRDDRGASAAEYTLLAAAIAALLVVTLAALGQHVLEVWGTSCESVTAQAAPGEDC